MTLATRRLAEPAGVRERRARVVRDARRRDERRRQRETDREGDAVPHEPSRARPIVPASVPNQIDFVGAW